MIVGGRLILRRRHVVRGNRIGSCLLDRKHVQLKSWPSLTLNGAVMILTHTCIHGINLSGPPPGCSFRYGCGHLPLRRAFGGCVLVSSGRHEILLLYPGCQPTDGVSALSCFLDGAQLPPFGVLDHQYKRSLSILFVESAERSVTCGEKASAGCVQICQRNSRALNEADRGEGLLRGKGIVFAGLLDMSTTEIPRVAGPWRLPTRMVNGRLSNSTVPPSCRLRFLQSAGSCARLWADGAILDTSLWNDILR